MYGFYIRIRLNPSPCMISMSILICMFLSFSFVWFAFIPFIFQTVTRVHYCIMICYETKNRTKMYCIHAFSVSFLRSVFVLGREIETKGIEIVFIAGCSDIYLMIGLRKMISISRFPRIKCYTETVVSFILHTKLLMRLFLCQMHINLCLCCVVSIIYEFVLAFFLGQYIENTLLHQIPVATCAVSLSNPHNSLSWIYRFAIGTSSTMFDKTRWNETKPKKEHTELEHFYRDHQQAFTYNLKNIYILYWTQSKRKKPKRKHLINTANVATCQFTNVSCEWLYTSALVLCQSERVWVCRFECLCASMCLEVETNRRKMYTHTQATAEMETETETNMRKRTLTQSTRCMHVHLYPYMYIVRRRFGCFCFWHLHCFANAWDAIIREVICRRHCVCRRSPQAQTDTHSSSMCKSIFRDRKYLYRSTKATYMTACVWWNDEPNV